MTQNVLKVLVKAIHERRCVALRYRDQPNIRVVEPHAVYANERGEVVVDAYQIRGYSNSGRPPPFWRPFRLKIITGLSLLKEEFRPRAAEGFSPHKLKYENGLIAIVPGAADAGAGFRYSDEALRQMGPFLPEEGRRTRHSLRH